MGRARSVEKPSDIGCRSGGGATAAIPTGDAAVDAVLREHGLTELRKQPSDRDVGQTHSCPVKFLSTWVT